MRCVVTGNQLPDLDEKDRTSHSICVVFDFSTLRMKTQLYKEISIGYAREWNDKLNVGINVKPLFGMVAGMTDINRLELRTSREKYEVLVDGIIRVSAPVSI